VEYAAGTAEESGHALSAHTPAHKETVGVDVFLDWRDGTPDELGAALQQVSGEGLELTMISSRGVKVWPGGVPETFYTDHWRCRFLAPQEGTPVSHSQIIALLQRVDAAGLDFIKTENLCTFDGKPGYSLDQGQ
jgi:isocitrate dehydrogenase